MFGTGKLVNDFSKPGYGQPGFALPAPLSNRMRMGFRASNAVSAAAYVGLRWIGSGGRLMPSIPKIAWNTEPGRGLDDRGFDDRRLPGDVELEEVVQAVEGLGRQRVDVRAVREGEPLLARAGEAARERRAVAARLLVGELAGHEGRHVDLVDERDGRQRIDDLGVVVVVLADLADEVRGLSVQGLVVLARLVALLDALVRPRLPAVGTRRHRLVGPLLRPVEGESRVQDPAGVERRRDAVDHRERRDRGEARRLGGGGEQLADAAVGDAQHPDLVVLDPWLARDRSR